MCDDIAKAAKDKTKNTKIVESAASKKDEIRLKGHCLLATKSEINELIASSYFCCLCFGVQGCFDFTSRYAAIFAPYCC